MFVSKALTVEGRRQDPTLLPSPGGVGGLGEAFEGLVRLAAFAKPYCFGRKASSLLEPDGLVRKATRGVGQA